MYRLTKEAEKKIATELAKHEPDIPVENVCTYLEDAANHKLERKGFVQIRAGCLIIKLNCMDFIKENFS